MAKQVHAFADANVVVDFLSRRAPFHADAFKLFRAAESGRITISVSALTIPIAHYLLRRVFDESVVRNELHAFSGIIQIVSVTDATLREALISALTDFEDAVQYECAKSIQDVSCIITRDAKHFSRSSIPVMSPLVFNAQYLK